MQSTSSIFGVLIVVVFANLRTYGWVIPFPMFGETADMSFEDYIDQIDDSCLEWFQRIFGLKRSTTTATTTSPPKTDQPVFCPTCTCGLTNAMQSESQRIAGGVETKKNEYPWMAQLMRQGQFYCGASVITSRYVVTAAHCIAPFNKDNITVRIGDHDRSILNETEIQDFKVEHVRIHSKYSSLDFNNDIAIVKLRGAIHFGGLLRPICLAKEGPTYEGMKGIVTGWGCTKAHGPTSDILLGVTVPIIPNSECRSKNYFPDQITDNMMCAGYAEGGKDACQGDSGGPLHVVNETDRIHRLVGILSWGHGCAAPGSPSVYTRVNRYLRWIRDNTQDACYCSDKIILNSV